MRAGRSEISGGKAKRAPAKLVCPSRLFLCRMLDLLSDMLEFIIPLLLEWRCQHAIMMHNTEGQHFLLYLQVQYGARCWLVHILL